MKKSVCLILAALLLCLCSCGGPEADSAPAESAASENSDGQETRVMTVIHTSEQGPMCKTTADADTIREVTERIRQEKKTLYEGPPAVGWSWMVRFSDKENYAFGCGLLSADGETYEMERSDTDALVKSIREMYDKIEGEEEPFSFH